jgi:hypothetical protein
MTDSVRGLVQESGVPLDVFIQSLTEQLDKAQASMALKARVGKLPLTFAVKDVSLDLRAFVQMVDDDVFLRPSSPGDTEASTIKLTLTTVTRSMIEENAVDFKAGSRSSRCAKPWANRSPTRTSAGWSASACGRWSS